MELKFRCAVCGKEIINSKRRTYKFRFNICDDKECYEKFYKVIHTLYPQVRSKEQRKKDSKKWYLIHKEELKLKRRGIKK
jgi:hypothetical protein